MAYGQMLFDIADIAPILFMDSLVVARYTLMG